jgi:hypothetical protein
LEFDGSLTGVGFRIFSEGDGLERLLGIGGITVPFDLHQDSSYQNAMELTAVVMALAFAAEIGLRQRTVHLRGDSMTVLSWLSGERSDIRSVLARAPAMTFLALCGRFNFIVDTAFSFIAGVDNWACDALSRGDLTLCSQAQPDVAVARDSQRSRATLQWCDPSQAPTTDIEFVTRWEELEGAFGGW